ncbi:hypothetical protein [Paralimibaculum aggregatum]|nr:hypothetical protein [Limibaculum sp. NKW23]
MSDNGDKALKLAEKNEKQIILLWKALARYEKVQAAWEKKQMDYIANIDKKLVEGHNAQNKYIADLHRDQDKRFTDLHNKQDKKFSDAVNNLVKWVEKTFDKKGLFN